MLRDLPSCRMQLARSIVVVLVLLGVLAFPAAGPVSAAGNSASAPLAVGPAELSQADCPEGGCLFYVPLIVKRWPPVPYAPQLAPIVGPIWDASVPLVWSEALTPDGSSIESYSIEEASTPDFATPVLYSTGPITSYTVAAKPLGVMGMTYYRVRGHSFWGAGDWSNTQSVLLLSQVDDFSYVETGWRSRRTSYAELDAMTSEYVDGQYITRVTDKFDSAIFSPLRDAPAVPYRISMRSKIVHLANEVSYGIAFGGNAGTFCDVERATAGDPNGCFYHYYRLNVVWGAYLKYSVSRIDYHVGPESGGSGRGVVLSDYSDVDPALISGPNDWVAWRIDVNPTGFDLYCNGHLLRRYTDTTYLNEPYYGIFSSTFEYNSSEWLHDYYYIAPLTDVSGLDNSVFNGPSVAQPY